MSIGDEVIDFIYSQQLQVDDQWALRRSDGFTWWADRNAQTVEIIGQDTAPDGSPCYLISVRTETSYGLELTDAVAAELNAGPMRFPTLSGPVYDPVTGTLSLCALARVQEQNKQWMEILLGSAAVLQLAEAPIVGERFDRAGPHTAYSAHPARGLREEPSAMLDAAGVFVGYGAQPLRLNEADFAAAVAQFMLKPPAVAAATGTEGITVEFPYGEASSMCVFVGSQRHPAFGSGLLIVQRFPSRAESEAAGIRLALELNRLELTGDLTGHGFGSYVYADDMICFNVFIPNGLLRSEVLGSLYYSCAARALVMSERLLGQSWDDDSFTQDHSAIGRRLAGESN